MCVVNEGVNHETHTILEYWSFRSKSVNEDWDMLEWLIGDTYKFEEVGCALKCRHSIHVLFIQDHISRNNLWNLAPFPLNPLSVFLLFVILVNHINMIPTLVLM